jgi:hypothetical protein
MSSWVVAALFPNTALVVAAIVYAVRLSGQSVVVAVELELQLHAASVSTADTDAVPRLPLFSPAQMTRTERRALLEAFDAARAVYLEELTAWRNQQPRTTGALSQARHDLDVAKQRLNRFERVTSSGVGHAERGLL